MDSFDVSARWVILAPLPLIPAAEDLARCIAVLRERDGLGQGVPPVMDASGPAPADSVPVVVLNMEDGGGERGGCAWRKGRDRVEIYGDSRRGLCNGIYDFLAALGFSWPGPGKESLPPRPGDAGGRAAGNYPLRRGEFIAPSDAGPERRRRLVVLPDTPTREIPALGRWAARNRVDALVFSFGDRRFPRRPKKPKNRAIAELENRWGLIIERGGWDFGFLIPRSLFFFKRELFRMEGGKRIRDHHFCPTNPEAIALLGRRIFPEAREEGAESPPRIYHLWPDRGAEHLWCACPACRAFMPREQIRMAVNAAAAVLVERDPRARISCRAEEESPEETLPGGSEILLHPNVFRLDRQSGLYIYENGRVTEFGAAPA
jgi:hypothetical protein